MEREKEKEQHEKEQHEKDLEFETERMKFERYKMDFELNMKAAAAASTSSDINDDEKGEENKEGSVVSSNARCRIGAQGPKMPCFDKKSDDMDSFLQCMQIAKDGVRDNGQYICQHF